MRRIWYLMLKIKFCAFLITNCFKHVYYKPRLSLIVYIKWFTRHLGSRVMDVGDKILFSMYTIKTCYSSRGHSEAHLMFCQIFIILYFNQFNQKNFTMSLMSYFWSCYVCVEMCMPLPCSDYFNKVVILKQFIEKY